MNIQNSTLVALLIGLMCGLAIGTQSTINSLVGKAMGSITTGLFVNLAGGLLSGILIVLLILSRNLGSMNLLRQNTLLIIVSGSLGIGIIAGIAYALQRTGVSAGLGIIIAGQMTVALIVDALGLSGGARIPVTPERILGLVLLFGGTWFLLKR